MSRRSALRTQTMLDEPTRRLRESIMAQPLAPHHTCVVAPGGHGKSVILAELTEAYRSAGLLVVDTAQEVDDLAGRDMAALVVDDAHRLGDGQLADLRRLVDTVRLPIAIGYRPVPRRPALAELADALGRIGPTLLPAPFDRPRAARLLALRCGVEPSDRMVDFVLAQTGGVPRLVDDLACALADRGLTDAGAGEAGAGADAGGKGGPLSVPDAAVLALRPDLEQLDDDVQRYLLAVEAGAGLHLELLSGLLGVDSAAVGDLMAAARATGLLAEDGALLPVSRRAVAALLPVELRIAVRQRLAELQLERGGPVLPLARGLLAGPSGTGASAAAVFHAAAREAEPAEPRLAARLYAAAVAAGRPIAAVAAGWAQSAARCGDLDTALRLADQVIAEPGAADRAQAACVAAAALAHRGQRARSAELYRWAGTGSALAFSAVELLATGRADAGEPAGSPGGPAQGGAVSGWAVSGGAATGPAPAGPAGDPPTMLAGAAALVLDGVRQSVRGAGADALATLVRAATLLEPTGAAELLPDSPAAVAAIVALHRGELDIADSVLDRAVAAGMGGELLAVRHRLLRAWIDMVRGATAAAVAGLTEVGATLAARGHGLEPRDALFAVALEVGLARRDSELPVLRQAWGHACEALVRHPVDLFTLLPLGELAVAAARLRDQDRVRPHLAEARSVLAALGNPPLWAAQLRWYGLHAAIIAEEPAAAEEHAAALAAAAGHDRYSGVLHAAALCWLAVLDGRVDADRVEAAARGLHAAGLCWDAARLAGQAAIRTSDRRAMVHLLDCARLLQGREIRPARPVAPAVNPAAGPTGSATAEPEPGTALSARELEVAGLAIDGLTYKEIGGRLFISAKTVEHHMARMRQKLGCANRSELLAQLRQLAGANHG